MLSLGIAGNGESRTVQVRARAQLYTRDALTTGERAKVDDVNIDQVKLARFVHVFRGKNELQEEISVEELRRNLSVS